MDVTVSIEQTERWFSSEPGYKRAESQRLDTGPWFMLAETRQDTSWANGRCEDMLGFIMARSWRGWLSMSARCAICRHPLCDSINVSLRRDGTRCTTREFQVWRPALNRHKRHIWTSVPIAIQYSEIAVGGSRFP